MPGTVIGLSCLLFFAISQGARDAFFGNVFQSVSFLSVALLAFGSSTLVFAGVALWRDREGFLKIFAERRAFAALNITTAVGWLGFFYALKYIEPAAVAALYNGVGPLAALAFGVLGLTPAASRISIGERICYAGIAASLSTLVAVVLTHRSGLAQGALTVQAFAIAVLILGGVMIAYSHVVARRLHDVGVGSDAVVGTRFLLTFAAAGVLEWAIGTPAARPSVAGFLHLTGMAFGLIVIPMYVLQLGVARSSALAVNVFRALGPVFVFAVQQLDGRLRFSGATLGCIAVFCVCAISASLLRGWSEARGPLA